jgi:D-glycerate 3-kinase
MSLTDEALIAALLTLVPDSSAGRPWVIGVSGAQGSGKTTLVRTVAMRIGAAQLSLDDVYLTQADRQTLARTVHPLFATRGPPGTHELPLLMQVLDQLFLAGPDEATPLPAFDKLADDRRPLHDWPRYPGRPGVILIDGWCLGATPQTPEALATPVNDLERREDPDGVWRGVVNDALAGPYAALWDRFDAFLHLAAPSFDVVQGWREQQEAGLLGHGVDEPRRAALARFVQHFERVSRHMLGGGRRPGLVARLDGARRLVGAAEESG